MQFSDIELPSNKKFGFFFTLVFFAMALFFNIKGYLVVSYVTITFGLGLLLVSIFKAEVLYPCNKIWMQLGFFLGRIVSPIVLGVVFFLLFVPIALSMRLWGRDELRLKLDARKSHWKKRLDSPSRKDGFKFQF